MINLYSGTPGSGKSLHTAADIRFRLQCRNPKITIGNFYVNVDRVKKHKGAYIMVENHRLTPERLRQFSRRLSRHLGRRLKEGEIVVYIDEAQLLFNSRDWNTKGRYEWLSFFTQHRHFGYDIVLVAQFDRMIDRQVRSLIEYEYMHRKVSRAGKLGAVIGFLCGGNLFLYVKKWYPLRERLESEFFLGGKRLYEIYDSYNEYEGFNEKPSKKVVRT